MIIRNANTSGLVAIVLWASSALIVVHTGDVPPMLLSSITTFLGFLLCSFYWLLKKENFLDKFRLSSRAYALGIFGICGYTSLWLIGLKLASAFEANALNYLWPLFLFIFSARIDRTSISAYQVIGFLLGIAGSLLIFMRHGIGTQNWDNLAGLLCALGGALIWASYSALTKKVHYESDRIGVFLLITSIITFVLHMVFEQGMISATNLFNMLMICLLGATRVSFVLWDYAMKQGDRQLLSSLSYLIPVLSVGLLAIFTKVEWTWGISLGALLIVIGCLVGNWERMSSVFSANSAK